jgi:zinc transporter, ZIP family
MSEFLNVLALTALPALGNFVGGLVAEVFPASPRTLSLALHAAAGVLLAVVGVELMPQALGAEAPWVVILAFVLGGVFFLLLDQG